jgi:hypothetical protein
MQVQIFKQKELLLLSTKEIEHNILHGMGIGVIAKRKEGKLYLKVEHHNACFEIMKVLKFDFDYRIHKVGKNYIIEI